MSWYISTANSFLERKILVGIQFMIWCWEVIRRFLSLKIPAPKLKRPQCSTAPRRPPVRAGPALLFTIFTWLTAFLWPLMLSGILQIDPFSVQGHSHKSQLFPPFSVSLLWTIWRLTNIFWSFLLETSDHQLCEWSAVMSYYHFLSRPKHNFLSGLSESATFKLSRHFHNKSLLSPKASYSFISKNTLW